MLTFTLASDSAMPGHPDKLCDRISDAIVDACLCEGPRQPVNAECAVASGVVFLAIRHAGVLSSDPAAIARREIAATGFPEGVFPAERTTVMVDATRDDAMSGPDAAAVDGLATVFGYATNATPDGLPSSLRAAHALTRALDAARRDGRAPWLSPDGRAQAALDFAARRVRRLRAVALRLGATSGAAPGDPAAVIGETVIAPALAEAGLSADGETLISVSVEPGGRGPRAHPGLTGRKTADDSYGGLVRHSASALSGKDPARAERVGSYAARHAALSVVAAGLAEECEVQLCYAPGAPAPLSVDIDLFGSGVAPDAEIAARVRAAFDFRPEAVAERFDLWSLPERRGGRFYADLACFGQMGRRDVDAPWETPDLAALTDR